MQAKQQAYLESMGIQVWQLRDRPAGDVLPPQVHLGPGTGEVLLLVCSADESAGKLSADIARALRSEPVWGWPAQEESATALEEGVAERLFTHILVFGAEAERAIFGGPAPELMGSAVVVRTPALGEIGQTPAKRRKLWATLCQHRLAGAPETARGRLMVPLVRPLWTDDLENIMQIEEASYPFPWTEGIFRDCIRAGYACYGLQLDQQLVGYSISNWAAGESHLLNLCIHPDRRCHGFGRVLLEHAVSHARSLGCHVMFLEVRPSNTDAAKLYRKYGFAEVGKRPAYYQSKSGREDAVIMRLDLLPQPTG